VAANIETRLHAARAGGEARSHDRDSLRDAGKKRALKQSMELNFIKQ
jgi:hypothetical protein